MAVYFLFIALFGNRENKYHSVIIFISCLLPILSPLEKHLDSDGYIVIVSTCLSLDSFTALILVLGLGIDKTAWKQALLLAFATLCHIMVILHLSTDLYFMWFISKPFYLNYSGLLVIIGILQMMVSYDGLINALSNLQELLLRTYHYCDRSYQGFFTRKDSEKRT